MIKRKEHMAQDIKKIHPPAFKQKVAIEALKGAETPGQLLLDYY